MKNLFSVAVILLIAIISNAQSDTSFVKYESLFFPANDHTEFSKIHITSDSTFIVSGQYIDRAGTQPLLFKYNKEFIRIKSIFPEYKTQHRDWDQPSFRSFQDTNSIYLLVYNEPDSSLYLNEYNYNLDLMDTLRVALDSFPEFVPTQLVIADSIIHISGYFNDSEDHKALYLKIDQARDSLIYSLKGSEIFLNSSSEFFSLHVSGKLAHIYFNGRIPESENSRGILRIDEEGENNIIHQWGSIQPWKFSFHFFDSTEYIFNGRNPDLPFPNWWAQYYENMASGIHWEAPDLAAAEFTAVTITGFSERENGNIFAFGIKENFFNPDSVEFPNLGNVDNFASAYVSELDRNSGERIWEYIYTNFNKEGEIDNSIIHDVIELSDGSLIAAGRSELDNVGDDVEPRVNVGLLIKLPPNGCFRNDCDDLLSFTSSTQEENNEVRDITAFNAYPNPSSDFIYLPSLKNQNSSDLKFRLFSIDGRSIVNAQISLVANNSIDISSLQTGKYIVQIFDKKIRKPTLPDLLRSRRSSNL
ncbi:T9SS type A sorting domain-containing protein [Portibacter marinus]|uniref:T9SS type A sorting domain-containing protein n=1 Tax=Portibacter marinus TaxID=2898660 RepID=UPI001F17F108|nr:T9SS type A sorting domain-containing protein [Portibacter marinus]